MYGSSSNFVDNKPEIEQIFHINTSPMIHCLVELQNVQVLRSQQQKKYLFRYEI